MPSEIYTFLAAMAPVLELRFSIPLGILHYDLPWHRVLLLSLAGNVIPVLPLLLALRYLGRHLDSSSNPIGKVLAWRARTLRTAQGARFKRYGALALVPFVAIPLPFTGAWTGTLAAWAFEIPPGRATLLIALGIIVAGAFVTAITTTSTFLWLLAYEE